MKSVELGFSGAFHSLRRGTGLRNTASTTTQLQRAQL
jgi:hypothetical protein